MKIKIHHDIVEVNQEINSETTFSGGDYVNLKYRNYKKIIG